MKPALFIDRDGTLNKDCPYCKDENEIVPYEDIFEPLKRLSDRYYIIIVTNQSGVGRGYFALVNLERMNAKIKCLIEMHGGKVDGIYYCPHVPEDNCECRKPKTGLVQKALINFNIDMAKSFVIGDDDNDMELAKKLGIKSIRVRVRGYVEGDYFAEDFYRVLSILNW